MNVYQSLTEFVEKYSSIYPFEQRTIEFDPDWPSMCVRTELAAGEMVHWSPVPQSPVQTFDNLEEALSLEIHSDVKAFYTAFWSDNLPAYATQGRCELLQPWNIDDFARLQENLIGHVLMKRRLKQAVTLFIGLTEDDDFILTVDNTSGNVMLEQVGREPCKKVANSLAEFLSELKVSND